MRKQSDFLDALLRGSGPSYTHLGIFLSGLISVSILGNLVYDLLTQPLAGAAAHLSALGGFLLFFSIAFGIYQLDRKSRRVIRVDIDDRSASPSKGIISVLGPNLEVLLVALEHHHQQDGAQHCWAIMQAGNSAVDSAFDELVNEASKRQFPTMFHKHFLQSMDTAACYKAVSEILEQEIGKYGLRREQVICDITGGIKPLTAGMVLASIIHDTRLEYVESERNATGNIIPSTQKVVKLDISYDMIRIKEGAVATDPVFVNTNDANRS